jgi:hypothetical protein
MIKGAAAAIPLHHLFMVMRLIMAHPLHHLFMIMRWIKISQVELIKELPIRRWNFQKLVSVRDLEKRIILTRSPGALKSTQAMRTTTHLLALYGHSLHRPVSAAIPSSWIKQKWMAIERVPKTTKMMGAYEGFYVHDYIFD